MLRMEVEQAFHLTRPIDCMPLISERAMMVVSPDRFLLAVFNEDHHLPSSLRLTPDWFLRYELTSTDDLGPHHYYVINFSFSTFRAKLLDANHSDRVVFHASAPWDTLRFTFVSQSTLLSNVIRVLEIDDVCFAFIGAHFLGGSQCCQMDISLAQNANLEPWISMDNSEHRFRIGVDTDYFSRILLHSIQYRELIRIEVKRSSIKLVSGSMEFVIHEDRGSWIGNIPTNTDYTVSLSLYRASYFLTACQMAPTIDFSFGRYLDGNTDPAPLMLIWCHTGGLLEISIPFMSVVRPQVECNN